MTQAVPLKLFTEFCACGSSLPHSRGVLNHVYLSKSKAISFHTPLLNQLRDNKSRGWLKRAVFNTKSFFGSKPGVGSCGNFYPHQEKAMLPTDSTPVKRGEKVLSTTATYPSDKHHLSSVISRIRILPTAEANQDFNSDKSMITQLPEKASPLQSTSKWRRIWPEFYTIWHWPLH